MQVFGRYALFEELARGGMATVHLGRLLGPAGFSRNVANASAGGTERILRTNSPSARPSSSGRPGPSPCQNGILPG